MEKEKVHYLYKIKLLCGKLKNKYYIGKHTGYLNDGYAGSGKIVKDYFKKYGRRKNVTYEIEILELNPTMEINAKREEIVLGNLWETDPDCINCCKGGNCGGLYCKPWNKGAKGCFSDETRKIMSEKHKGLTPWMKGKHHSDEAKKKISAASKGRIVSDETRKKLSEAGKGRVFSKESRKKISDGNKGKTLTQEQKEKLMKPIVQYTIEGEFVKEWKGAREADRELGISYKQIWKGLNGLSKHPGGFIWKYKKEEVD